MEIDKKSQLQLLTREFKEGEVIVKEREASDTFYLLQTGEVFVYVGEQKIGEIVAGGEQEFFGEVGAILGIPRTATVVAQGRCKVLEIPVDALESAISKAPSLGLKLIRSLARKIASQNL